MAYIAQRRTNSHWWYMALAEFGGGRCGFIVFLEGREGRGWSIFAAELRKVVALFDSVVDVGSSGMVSWQVYSGSTWKGLSDIPPVLAEKDT